MLNYHSLKNMIRSYHFLNPELSQVGPVYSGIIRYADNGENWEETKLATEKTMPKIVDWLKIWCVDECHKNRSLFIWNKKVLTKSFQCNGREHIS
jgi:hypothetical protein